MRVLITGGTGLIGRSLAALLAQAGYEVIVLSRRPEAARWLPAGARAVGWDGKTAAGWGQLADGAAGIINLAGENLSEGRWTAERKQRIVDSRVHAGEAVVEAVGAAATRPQVVIQASGVGYYGPHGDETLTESAPPGADFLAQVAVRWEAATAGVEDMGVRRVITRSGVVLSREGGAFPRMLLPFRFFAGGRHGHGRQWLTWIHMADEVGAIRVLLEDPSANGPYNLAAPQALPNREFVRLLGVAMRRPAWLPVPALAFRVLFGEMSTVLLDGQRAVPQKLERAGYRFRYPNALDALRDLVQ